MTTTIETGRNGMGLRWAREGEWRVTAYVEDGYAVTRLVNGSWIIDRNIPLAIEKRLRAALGIANHI